jgi:hypothetical protein
MHPRAATSDLASLPRWAPALPHVLQPQTSHSYRGGLWRCHMFRGPVPRLLAEVSSSTAMCPLAPDLASLLR